MYLVGSYARVCQIKMHTVTLHTCRVVSKISIVENVLFGGLVSQTWSMSFKHLYDAYNSVACKHDETFGRKVGAFVWVD